MSRPSIFVFAAASLAALTVHAQEPADVLLRHAEARGGVAAVESLRSVDLRITIEEGWVLEGHYRASRDGYMRIDVYAGEERVFTEALLDGSAWAMQQGETNGSPITQEEAHILGRGILGNLYGLHEFESQGVDVVVRGPEALDGTPYWVVDLTHGDGFEDRYYLDTESFLIARQRSDHALHPAVDPEVKRFESLYSGYREVDGVLFPFVREKFDLESGELVQRTTIHSLEVNGTLERSDFEMP